MKKMKYPYFAPSHLIKYYNRHIQRDRALSYTLPLLIDGPDKIVTDLFGG